jgi:hypothetical protein
MEMKERELQNGSSRGAVRRQRGTKERADEQESVMRSSRLDELARISQVSNQEECASVAFLQIWSGFPARSVTGTQQEKFSKVN